MAIVRFTHEELLEKARLRAPVATRAKSDEEIERLADEDELDESYGIAVDYRVDDDGVLTEVATGIRRTRTELLDHLVELRTRETFRNAAE